MKKFFSALVFVICFFCINFSTVNAQKFNVVAVENVEAWQFMKNWGYENYFEYKQIADSWTNPTILSTYTFFIPCNDIGLGKIGTFDQTGELAGAFGLYVSKKSGTVAGFEFYFDSESEPEKTISSAMRNLLGDNIFNDAEKSNFIKVITNAKLSNKYEYDYYLQSLNIYLKVLKATVTNYGDGWYKIAIITLKAV